MISPEQLISQLQTQIVNLQQELEEAYKDICDFEILAIEWKKGHRDLETKHRVKIRECEQIIRELQDEIEELKAEKSLKRIME